MELTVTAEITAVEFRHLNSFEWAVLGLLKAFPEEPPSLVEAAARLALGEPALLQAALNELVSIEAVVCRADKARQHDLNDFSITEHGREILTQDGWECGEQASLTEEFLMDWPAGKIRLEQAKRQQDSQRKQSGPTTDEVDARLSLQQLDEMLNSSGTQTWRTKSFYVTSVEVS